MSTRTGLTWADRLSVLRAESKALVQYWIRFTLIMFVACGSTTAVLYVLTYIGAMIEKVVVNGEEQYVIHWEYVEFVGEFPFVALHHPVVLPPKYVVVAALVTVSVAGGVICASKLTLESAR